MNRSIAKLLMLSLWLLAGPAFAAEPVVAAQANTPAAKPETPAPLNFTGALSLAGENNQTYRIAVEKAKAAHAQWWEAVLRFGPTVSLQAGYVLDNKPMIMSVDFGGMTQNLEMSTNYYSGQLVAAQPLFTGLKLTNGLTIAGLQAENARAEKVLAGNKLYEEVVDAYYGVVVAENLLAVTRELVKQTEEHIKVVKARHREGSASNYDLLRSEVQLANLRPNLLQAENGYVLAKRALAMKIGLDPQAEVQLQDSLGEPGKESLPDLKMLQEQARKQRLELQNVDRSRRMAAAAHTLAVTGYLPNVALTGTWTYYDTEDQGFPPAGENLKHYWTVMLGMEWTLWDNLAAWPKTEAADSQVRQAELGREAMEQGIALEVESAYLSLQAALETSVAQAQAIRQAEEGYRIAKTQFANGLMTTVDVMDAQLALNQAKINQLRTQYDYIQAKIRLQTATGEDLEHKLSEGGKTK